jgi:hypothetical protein
MSRFDEFLAANETFAAARAQGGGRGLHGRTPAPGESAWYRDR